MKYILFIAPFHSDNDKRVTESILLSKEYFEKISILYDSNYNNVTIGNNLNTFYYPIEIKTFWKVKYPNLRKWLNNLNQELTKCDVIYIHDSGIMGIFISKILSVYSKPIILDYHDNVFYELFYQLKKIKLSRLYPIFKSPFFYYLKVQTKHISYLVGINELQIEQFRTFFDYKKKYSIVSNFRKNFSFHNPEFANFEKTELLWIGNVMRGRDLELLVKIIDNNHNYRLNIIGNILDISFKNEINEILKNRVSFFGAFKDENEISNLISFKPIGIYLGWNDKYNTMINEMSSPNKIFTYINLSIPFIFSNRFLNDKSVLDESLGCAINMESNFIKISKEFHLAYDRISSNYENYVNSLILFKNKSNSNQFKSNNYFNEIRKLVN